MAKQRKRPYMSRRIANVMMDELSSLGNRIVGDEFEGIKTIARCRLSKQELDDLCLCLSSALLCNNGICRITEIRGAKEIPFNHENRMIRSR